MAKLASYRAKRDFTKTSEPKGTVARGTGALFVVQKHDASRLHYDFRLELGGVLKSWAVAKGPSLVPGEKRLAVHVEDHPLAYGSFEGTIPKGQYGGGTVMLWDTGRWEPERDPHKGYAKGHLTFRLNGEKLKGTWHLIRMRKKPREKQESWLLIKSDDEFARTADESDILEEKPLSAKTGRALGEIAREASAPSRSSSSKRRATKPPEPKRSLRAKSTVTARSGHSNIEIAGVILTHPNRILWEEQGLTKQSLAEFYVDIADWILPHVVNRPLALVRCPSGSQKGCFFQKHSWAGLADEVMRDTVRDESGEEEVLLIRDIRGIVALVQAGVLEIHPWGARIDDIEHPDRMTFDFDPGDGVPWSDVIEGARELRERLKMLGLESFAKTTGGKGLHVVVPLIPKAGWDEVKSFARTLAEAMEADRPGRYLTKATKSERGGKIFVDYLRNGRGATAVAAYSTRARPGAPVATPLAWDELSPAIKPNHFTVTNLPTRLGALREDPWARFFKIRQTLPARMGKAARNRK